MLQCLAAAGTSPIAPSASAAGPGLVPAGDWEYAATFIGPLGETLPGASTALHLDDPSTVVIAVPTGPDGTTGRNVYRRYRGSSDWGLVGGLSDNTSTTVAENSESVTSAGLIATMDWTPWVGNSTHLQSQTYGMAYGYPGMGGGIGPASNQGPSGTTTLNGITTWKWLWSIPNDPLLGTPDFTDFPAPPLLALAKINGQLSTTSNDNADKLTATGHLNDSTDPANPLNLSIGKIPDKSPADGAAMPFARHIIPLSVLGDHQTYEAHLSPSADLSISGGAQSSGYPGYPGFSPGSGSGWGSAWMGAEAHAITLSAPNPMGHPEWGDGSNQFVYDDGFPNGKTVVPASTAIGGGTQADSDWLAPLVKLPVLPATQNNIQPYDLVTSPGSIEVQSLDIDSTGNPTLDYYGLKSCEKHYV